MVHINLLPLELKLEAEKKFSSSKNHIPLEIVVGSVGGVLLLIIFLHVVLMSLGLKRLASFKGYEKQWETLETRKAFIDGLNKEMVELKAEKADIDKLFFTTFYEWAEVLNHFSSLTPKGIWYSKMTIDPEGFVLEGHATPREMDELVMVHNYVNVLRSSRFLRTRFEDFILDSVQKQQLAKGTTADFLIKSAIFTVDQVKKPEEIKISLPAEGVEQESERMVFDDLPGIPEEAKKNLTVSDKKPITSIVK